MIQRPSIDSAQSVFPRLKGTLIVSCQADPGDPMDHVDTIRRMATSVLRGGAAGLRAEGAECVKAFRAITDLPIIGMVKTKDSKGKIYITPTFAAAQSVSNAGSDVIAVDCTNSRLVETEPWPEIVLRIQKELRRPVLADIATVEDGVAAQEAGVSAVATTLYGYTDETAGMRSFSWSLLETLVKRLDIPVIAEGHINDPADVRRALDMGAHAVLVGSAITRPQSITVRFVAATRS